MNSRENPPRHCASDIWSDDLLNRREEANFIASYVECVLARKLKREDRAAYSISVDAGYGEGKTFFLTRLAKELRLKHPVAYVDAWADDLLDEPLTALLATLNEALSDLLHRHRKVRKRWDAVKAKTGAVAKIAAKGAFKRGLGLVITPTAAEGISEVFEGAGEAAVDAASETTKDLGKDIAKGAMEGLSAERAKTVLEKRIADFASGRAAIQELKASLRSLVAAVAETHLEPPIVIIIDELDRCRPTYAIKLLEEIKHLFDVPGFLFVLGTHGGQLAHSVSAAYGAGFDGQAYLKRFVDREYHLRAADLGPLVARLVREGGITERDFLRPLEEVTPQGQGPRAALPYRIAGYMRAFGLGPRDTFSIIDMIQTCVALASEPLIAGYLFPLIISRYKGAPRGSLLSAGVQYDWSYITGEGSHKQEHDPGNYAQNIRASADKTDDELMDLVNKRGANHFDQMVLRTRMRGEGKGWADLRQYPELVDMVGRLRVTEADPTAT